MIALEHLPLWQKIQPFTIDDPQAATPFSAKLAKEQSWSPAFTSRAIEEYKKFILLCCISEKGASPSKTVDEVWHLHLTYTRNYWKDFCGDTLERELHHHPSAGGNNEDLRHLEWYRDTLNLYRQTFGEEAPADIWPPPLPPEPEEIPEPSFEWRSNGWILIALLALPFVFIGISYDTFSPFELGGPHFLVFFPVCAISFLAAYCLYIDRVNAGLVNTVRDYFPVDVTAFQIAGYLYGKHRALQVAIVNMIESNMLTVEPDGQHFRVHNRSYAQRIYEINPLAETWAAQENDSIHSYKDILGNWFDREKFKHPRLEAFDRFVHRKEKTSMARKALIGVLAGILLARFIQAAGNNRPVSFLMVETVLLSIVIAIVASVTRRPRLVNYLIKQHFTKSYDRDASLKLPIADRYAIEGRSAIAFFSEGVILSALFDKYDPRRFRSGLGNWENSSDNSGTGGGGDSGGSSCGGGSCGGGGGCGGCGGGH